MEVQLTSGKAVKFNFDATAIGSIPLTDPRLACKLILETFPSIPFWPQLPKRSFKENMYVQYAERLPGLIVDEKQKTIHVDSQKALEEMGDVYEKYLASDIEFFKISEEYAVGLYEFLRTAQPVSKAAQYVKGHVTGPVSFALSVTDENKQAIIYNKDIFEVVTKLLVMKARWQIRKLKELNTRTIMFIDEPYLVSIGSSYVNINREEVAQRLDDLIGAIKAEGALCGIHCCGNTDWSFLLKRDIDIISFDAYNFAREFSLYADDISAFLAKGGSIAWGIVPSADAVDHETDASLIGKLKEAIGLLAAKGIDTARLSSLVTPSCGVGSLDDYYAKKVLQLTKSVAERAKSVLAKPA